MSGQTVSGTVIRGEQRGRHMGFPTANIPCETEVSGGTYAGIVHMEGGQFPAAIYADNGRHILEAYILNFSKDIYGKEIRVQLIEKIAEPLYSADEKEISDFVKQAVLSVRSYFA